MNKTLFDTYINALFIKIRLTLGRLLGTLKVRFYIDVNKIGFLDYTKTETIRDITYFKYAFLIYFIPNNNYIPKQLMIVY